MIPGCEHVEKTVKRWNQQKRTYEDADLFCGRLVAEGRTLCPKHDLIKSEQENERSHRAIKSAKTRKFREQMREALKLSPLAAVNPKFTDAGTRKVWMEPETKGPR